MNLLWMASSNFLVSSCEPKSNSAELNKPDMVPMPVAVEREEWKFDTLCDLYDTLTVTQV